MLKVVGALGKVHSSSLEVEGGLGGSGILSILSATGEGCRSIEVGLGFDQEVELSGMAVAVREERGERWSWLSRQMVRGGREFVRRRRGHGRCQVANGPRVGGESGKGESSGQEVSGMCRLVCGVEWRQ